MISFNFLACSLILLLLIQQHTTPVNAVDSSSHRTGGQTQERSQQTASRNLHQDSSVSALPSCCYLECPSGRTLRTGSHSSRLRDEHDSRSLHRINHRANCAYNCDACGANCCSCNQVSSARRSAVEMQCTCTPGCDHHHHFSTDHQRHHHHHYTNTDFHHHHFTESSGHHYGITMTHSHAHRD